MYGDPFELMNILYTYVRMRHPDGNAGMETPRPALIRFCTTDLFHRKAPLVITSPSLLIMVEAKGRRSTSLLTCQR
jgi:hypothetical protein